MTTLHPPTLLDLLRSIAEHTNHPPEPPESIRALGLESVELELVPVLVLAEQDAE